MNIESLTPSAVQKLVDLTKDRERLLEQVEAIEAEIVGLFGGKMPSLRRRKKRGRGRPPKKNVRVSGKKPGKKKETRGRKKKKIGDRGQKPGALKGRILGLLAKAGEEGMKVSDIATKLDVPKPNVHVWFSTTGKNLKEIDKVKPGCFRFCEK